LRVSTLGAARFGFHLPFNFRVVPLGNPMGWRHFMSRVHVVSDAVSRRFRPIPSGRNPLALGRALGSPADLIRSRKDPRCQTARHGRPLQTRSILGFTFRHVAPCYANQLIYFVFPPLRLS
jgi:hypothetical protein